VILAQIPWELAGGGGAGAAALIFYFYRMDHRETVQHRDTMTKIVQENTAAQTTLANAIAEMTRTIGAINGVNTNTGEKP